MNGKISDTALELMAANIGIIRVLSCLVSFSFMDFYYITHCCCLTLFLFACHLSVVMVFHCSSLVHTCLQLSLSPVVFKLLCLLWSLSAIVCAMHTGVTLDFLFCLI